MNKRITKKYTALFFLLSWQLLFIPQASAAGWQDETAEQVSNQPLQTVEETSHTLTELIYDSSEHFSDIDTVNLDGLLNRIGDARVVLLGEASHGTAEFYDMRARITRELIENKDFNIVAVEADWPDAASIDFYIRGPGHGAGRETGRDPGRGSGHKPILINKPFSGFPKWMWRNHSVLVFTHWLKNYNRSVDSAEHVVGFYGLDLYNLSGSIEAVLAYLQDVNPKLAEVARWRYGCLVPWLKKPSLYSRDMQSGRYRGCRNEVLAVLQDLHNNRTLYRQADKEADSEKSGQRYFNAVQNARLIRNGERYYRTMYRNSSDSWNQRDENMLESLQAILHNRSQNSKAVVWAHNSHIGDARATDMSAHGQYNLGQRVRETFAESAYLIGFGTDHGTVAAASEWGGPMKAMKLPPAHHDSYEHLFHQVKTDNFLLPLRKPVLDITRKKLLIKRLQRAIGVTYDPENELKKHYYPASLPEQFDEYIWFDETQAVQPLSREW